MWRAVDLHAPAQGRVARRGGLAFVGLAVQGLVRFLTSFMVGRLTGPATLAAVASALSLANILALLWPTTAGGAAARFIARARGQEDGDPSAVARFLGMRTLLSVALLGPAAIPLWVLLGGRVWEGALVAVLLLCFSGYAFTSGVHYGAGQSVRQVRWELVTSLLGLSGVLLVLLSPLPAFASLGALAVGYGVYTVGCWPWGARGALPRSVRREIDAFVAWGSLGTIASAGFVQFAMIMSTIVAGREAAGQFAAAMALAAPAAMIANALSMVLFPQMSEALGRGDLVAFRSQLDRATRVLVAVVIAAFGLLVIGARPIVELVWGPRYAMAAAVLPLLLIPAMARGLAAPSQGAVTTGLPRGVVFASLCSVGGLTVGALVWGVMPAAWGIVGVAAGYAGGTIGIALALIIRAWRVNQLPWLGLACSAATGTAVMAGLAVSLRLWAGPVIVDAVAALAFAAGWLLWRRSDVAEALQAVKRR